MDITNIVYAALSILGGATILLRIVAPTTKNVSDDNILRYLEKFLEVVSLDSKAVEGDYLKIKLKDK